MPMKPSRIVLSSSSPNGPCLSYYSTRCPKLPSKLVLLYFAGADRHAASTVERPTFPRTALVVYDTEQCQLIYSFVGIAQSHPRGNRQGRIRGGDDVAS